MIEVKGFTTRQLGFINYFWAKLAAIAYSGFLKDGRGIVAIDLRNTPLNQAPAQAMLTAHYLCERQGRNKEIFEALGGWPMNADALIESYNPDTQIVCLALDQSPRFQIITRKPSPIEAGSPPPRVGKEN